MGIGGADVIAGQRWVKPRRNFEIADLPDLHLAGLKRAKKKPA